MLLWTFNVEEAIKNRKLRAVLQAQESRLDTLVELVRGDLPSQARLTFGTLVVLDVHCKDIIQSLIEHKILEVEDFQ